MARLGYDATAPLGKLLASAVRHLITGRQELAQFVIAADEASSAGTLPDNLVGEDFGAAPGQGDEMFTLAQSVKTLLDGDDAGGLGQFLGRMDKNVAG